MPKVVTANTLATGVVVYLGAGDCWVRSIDDATIYADADAAEAGLDAARRAAAQAIVVDPFVTDTGADTDGRPKMTLRDTIRAYGPTIRFLPSGPKAA